jgi:hypothetical protein
MRKVREHKVREQTNNFRTLSCFCLYCQYLLKSVALPQAVKHPCVVDIKEVLSTVDKIYLVLQVRFVYQLTLSQRLVAYAFDPTFALTQGVLKVVE